MYLLRDIFYLECLNKAPVGMVVVVEQIGAHICAGGLHTRVSDIQHTIVRHSARQKKNSPI